MSNLETAAPEEQAANSIEAHPDAALVLSEAGWAPHPEYGVFTFSSIVCGITPDGMTLHIKDWSRIPPGHPLYSEDTPDTAVEAAEWLKRKFTNAMPVAENPLSLESLEFVREAEETAGDVAVQKEPLGDDNSGPAADQGEQGQNGNFGIFTGEAAGLVEPADAEFSEAERQAIADFQGFADEQPEELGAEILETEAEYDALPPPDPEDFAGEEIEENPAGAFIFGDNLAHDRIVRIGQLAEHANALIDAAKLGYSESEHNAVRSHVVTNMNEAGAYVGGNQAMFDRFIELEAVTARIARIEQHRDRQQDYIRGALHAEVAAFDPEAGWP